MECLNSPVILYFVQRGAQDLVAVGANIDKAVYESVHNLRSTQRDICSLGLRNVHNGAFQISTEIVISVPEESFATSFSGRPKSIFRASSVE